MVARVTGAPKVDSRAYKAARDAGRRRSLPAAKLAPECVRTCRSPDEVWTYVKGQFMLDTYQSRRRVLPARVRAAADSLGAVRVRPTGRSRIGRGRGTGAQRPCSPRGARQLERRSADPRRRDHGRADAVWSRSARRSWTIMGEDLRLRPTISRSSTARCPRRSSLAPADYTDEQLRRILGGATTVVEGLGSLRNRRGRRTRARYARATSRARRHAGLAVNLAGSVAVFLMQTWEGGRRE